MQNIPTMLLFDIILNLILAFVLGLVISGLYRYTNRKAVFSEDLVNTIIIITMVTSVVIMVIGNNLARAFGLVGAMSIIRFRTVLKSSRDIAFVFFALATGMAAGAGNHSIAIAGVCVIGFIVLILFWIRYGQGQKELFLKFWMVPEERGEARYIALFQKYLSKYVMMNMRSAQLGQYLELSFIIQLFKQENLHRFIRDMSSLEGIERVTLVTDEKSDK
jgi:uncharacterized membrane protein YhiD involved in acid resistance